MAKAAGVPLLSQQFINLTGVVKTCIIAHAAFQPISIEFNCSTNAANAHIYIGNVGVVNLPYVTQLTTDPKIIQDGIDISPNSTDLVEKMKIVHDQVIPYFFRITNSQLDTACVLKHSRTVSPVLAEAAPLAAPQAVALQNVA